jgi:hypothetical protein
MGGQKKNTDRLQHSNAIVGDFNASLSPIDRSFRQKKSTRTLQN